MPAPLPPDVFVFERVLPQGGEYRGNFVAFNLKDRTERVLGIHPGSTNGVVISADRRWLLYAGEDTIPVPGGVNQIWRMSVDGKRREKLFAPPYDNLSSLTVFHTVRTPVWASDGTTLLYSVLVTGAFFVHWVDRVRDGVRTASPDGCDLQTPFDPHPTTGTLLVFQRKKACGDGNEGVAEWTVDPLRQKRTIIPAAETEGDLAVWLKDGSGIFYQGQQGLMQFSESTAEKKLLWKSEDPKVSIDDITTGRGGEIVLGLATKTGSSSFDYDIHLLNAASGTTDRLTTTKNSKHPRF